jgi:hypothetical protein
MTLDELQLKINEFYLESSKDPESGERIIGTYPNSIILTKGQYKEFLRELFKLEENAEMPDGVLLSSINGLKVFFTEYLPEPKVIFTQKTKK